MSIKADDEVTNNSNVFIFHSLYQVQEYLYTYNYCHTITKSDNNVSKNNKQIEITH